MSQQRAYCFQYGHIDSELGDVTDVVYDELQKDGVLELPENTSWEKELGDPMGLCIKFLYVIDVDTHDIVGVYPQYTPVRVTGLFKTTDTN